jgi:HSP20 family protein
MSMIRYKGGLRGLFDEMEELVNTGFDLIGRQVGRSYPSVDIVENGDHFLVLADLPGMTRDEIEIKIENGVMTLSGEKKRYSHKSERGYTHFERSYGKFSRSFNVPDGVDDAAIEAHYREGVLEIVLRKKASQKSHSVDIEVE